MYEFAERTDKWYSGNKTKTEFYSQLFIVSTIEAETMSDSGESLANYISLYIFCGKVFAGYNRCEDLFFWFIPRVQTKNDQFRC